MKLKSLAAIALLGATILSTGSAFAGVTLSIVSSDTGGSASWLRGVLDDFQKQSGDTVKIVGMPNSTTDQFGQYKLWLAAGNSDIDVYQTDVIWAPQLSDQFVDLTAATKDIIGNYFPSIVQSQTSGGKLVALPFYTDAPALFYRKDLLAKYNLPVPKTWEEMAKTAKTVMDGERAAGNKDMWGFVFQGNAYEGLTCDALEWVKSYGGGQIVEPDGTISINNDKAAAALEEAKSWVGTISPPGVLSYDEEASRGVWQLGNAVFMRNWPYAYANGNQADSPIKGKFDATTLPVGAAGDSPASTLGGWNLAVSKYSKNQDEAIKLVRYLSSPEVQKSRAVNLAALPTLTALYDDADIAKAQPIIPQWKAVFQNAVPRPSGPTKTKYNEVSNDFWSAVHDTLAGNGSAKDNLEALEAKLTELKGDGW
jgi:trehalose/maltose transport system substrate-binding protein